MKYSYYSTKNNKLFYDIQEVKGFLISTGQIKPDEELNDQKILLYNIYPVLKHVNYPEKPELVEFYEPLVIVANNVAAITYKYRELTKEELEKNYMIKRQKLEKLFKEALNPLDDRYYKVVFSEEESFLFKINSETLITLQSALKIAEEKEAYKINWKTNNKWIELDKDKIEKAFTSITEYIEKNYTKLYKLLKLLEESDYESIYKINLNSVEL